MNDGVEYCYSFIVVKMEVVMMLSCDLFLIKEFVEVLGKPNFLNYNWIVTIKKVQPHLHLKYFICKETTYFLIPWEVNFQEVSFYPELVIIFYLHLNKP